MGRASVRAIGVAAAVLLPVLGPGAARAQEAAAAPSPWSLRLEGATSFPLDLGVRATLEGPARLQLVVSAGYTPRRYTETLNRALVALGAYGEDTGELVTSAYSDGLLGRAYLGWRPFARRGFHVLGGYGLMGLGGGLTTPELLAVALGEPAPEREPGEDDVVRARATLQQLHAELGWKWTLGERVSLGLGLGGLYTFAAHAEITPRSGNVFVREGIRALAGLGEAYLEKQALRYVHGPYASLTLGVKLF